MSTNSFNAATPAILSSRVAKSQVEKQQRLDVFIFQLTAEADLLLLNLSKNKSNFVVRWGEFKQLFLLKFLRTIFCAEISRLIFNEFNCIGLFVMGITNVFSCFEYNKLKIQ